MCRNLAANFGDTAQLGRPFRVFFRQRHFIGEIRMSFGKQDGGVARDGHGSQLLLLVGCFGIVHEIEPVQFFPDTFFQIQQSVLIHLSVQSGMSRSTLFHKFGKHPHLIGLLPLLRYMAEDTFSLGTSFPVRDHFAFIRVNVFLADRITLQFTCVQDMQVLHTMAGQFRKSRHTFRFWSAFAHDQFILADIDRLLLADLIKIHGPKNRNRIFSVVFLVETSFYQSAFNRQGGLGFERLLSKTFDPVIHSIGICLYCGGEIRCTVRCTLSCDYSHII